MTILLFFLITLCIFYSLTIIAFIIGLYFPKSGKNTSLKKVSIVIAARDEEKNISGILTDLLKQTYPSDLYEVLVVDDYSTDKTADIIESFSSQYNNCSLIRIESCPAGFSPKKYAIQTAIYKAQGDIILATDADCHVGPEWIETMVQYFDFNVGFVIGFSQFGKHGEKQNFIEKLQAFDFIPLMGAAAASANLGYPLAASGQNLGYLKKGFHQLNGYEKVAHRVSGDDVLLLQLFRKFLKYKIIFASDEKAYATSQPQATLTELLNQRKRWASNGSYQVRLNIPFFIYLLQVFLFNLTLFVAIPLVILYKQYAEMIFACLTIKALLEFAVSWKSVNYFKRKDLLRYFPLWFIFQMPYVLLVGLLGSFGRFNWKNRSHGSEIKQK